VYHAAQRFRSETGAVTGRPVRYAPLEAEAWSEEAAELLRPLMSGSIPPNIFKTLARHPKLLKRWLVFANHVLAKNSLPPREREIAILRIGYLCKAPYEWGQHVLIARNEAAMSDADIARVKAGPDAPGWTPAEAALLRAVDELHAQAWVTDSTFAALQQAFDEQQIMDLVFTVGQYNLVSMALNTFGVPLDDGLPAMDDH
jgi:4-carboxymuconolactone decarboxylase